MTIGEATTSAIEALRHQPGMLAIVILQLATMAMIYFVLDANAQRQQAREVALIHACGDRP